MSSMACAHLCWTRFASHSSSTPAYLRTSFAASRTSCSTCCSKSSRDCCSRSQVIEGPRRAAWASGVLVRDALGESSAPVLTLRPWLALATLLCMLRLRALILLILALMASQSHLSHSLTTSSASSVWSYFRFSMDFTKARTDVMCRSCLPCACSFNRKSSSSALTSLRSVGLTLRFLLSTSRSGRPLLTWSAAAAMYFSLASPCVRRATTGRCPASEVMKSVWKRSAMTSEILPSLRDSNTMHCDTPGMMSSCGQDALSSPYSRGRRLSMSWDIHGWQACLNW
mmetsp:Transcript_70264/g.198332  ORF Transcript_70264/g.198332 Transcript_70264/m.198332 type:complete len:284 (+) Transcript_70264:486-1337(+)